DRRSSLGTGDRPHHGEQGMTGATMAAKPKKQTSWANEIWQLFLLALAVLGVHSFIAKPFYIPSGSMLPTQLIGDQLIVSKFPYGYSYLSPSIPFVGPILPAMPGRLFGSLPRRGDIAVIKSPVTKDDWIQRVNRLPRFRETIDGRSYDVADLGQTPQDNYPATVVPEGHVFLMGDNRDNSEDSRFPSDVGLGMLPIENLVGRAEFITYSIDGSWSL